jgi:hypothetical protein
MPVWVWAVTVPCVGSVGALSCSAWRVSYASRWSMHGQPVLACLSELGAAGGYTLSGCGFVMQGYRLSKATSVMVTVGRVQSGSGEFKANVLGLSIAYQFTGFVSK